MQKSKLLFVLSSLFAWSFTMLHAQVFYEGPGWTGHGSQAVTAYGWSMCSAGDVNGDGYIDLLVSAIDHSEPVETEEEEGKLYLYYGGPDGPDTIADWTYQPNQTLSITGFATDGGDLNGDGYSDFAAGCIQWAGTELDEGRVIFFYGGPSGPAAEPDWQFTQGQAYALVGSGIGLSGDINNDGYNDLFMSAKMWDGGEEDEGKVWMYYGSPTGPVNSGWTWEPNQAGSIAGFPISYAGDVNGDGIDDVVIGVNQHDSIFEDDGLAIGFYGTTGALSTTPDWQVTAGQKKSNFGHWVDGAGDVNGDGYGDVIVAALLYETSLATGSEGAVFVYHGSASGLSTTANWSRTSGQLGAQLGYCTAGCGDINGDGYSDVIAGAKYWTNGEDQEGGAFVAFGSSSGLEDAWCWSDEGNQELGYYGRFVNGGADFNYDGYSDFLVSAYRYTDVYFQDGKGYLYYGAPRREDFHYEKDSFCINEGFAAAIIDGESGGTFSSISPGLVFSDISTGTVDLAESGSGVFQITYTLPDGCLPVTRQIIIGPAISDAGFTYSNTTYLQSEPNQLPTFPLGSVAGVFTATPDGLSINSSTGEINCALSTPGTYTITNTVSNGYCTNTGTISVTIQLADAIENLFTNMFNLYPNPTTDVLTVSFNESLKGGCLLQINDLSGSTILSTTISSFSQNKTTISVHEYSAGVYILSCTFDGNTQRMTFVVSE